MKDELVIEKISAKPHTQSCIVLFTNGEEIECSRDLIIKHALAAKMVMTPELQTTILQEQEVFNVKQAALSYASYKPRTVKQISEKLRSKKFSDEMIRIGLDFLANFDLVDDNRYAESFIKEYIERKPTSKFRVLQELTAKGIDRELAENAVNDFYPEHRALEFARKTAEKKLRLISNKPLDKQKSSLITYLQRQGFKWEVISNIIHDIFVKDE